MWAMKKKMDVIAAAALFSRLSPEVQDRVIGCLKELVKDKENTRAGRAVKVKERRRKAVKYIFFAVAAAGFILLIGTAGSSDTGTIGWDQMIVQIVIGLSLLLGGGVMVGILERGER